MTAIDFSGLTPADVFSEEDEEEQRYYEALIADAKAWLSSFEWCRGIREAYVGIAVGGVVGVFLCRIEPASPVVDEWLWVVVGDLPPAYLVTDDAPTPADALEAYCWLMQEWVDAVYAGDPLDDLIPVDAAPTREHADMLKSRLEFLRTKIVPDWR